MTPEIMQLLAFKSLGGAVGIFIGAVIGLSIRKSNGHTNGLFRNSVYATAILASGVAFAALFLVRLITY